jgi:TPR repeat protein
MDTEVYQGIETIAGGDRKGPSLLEGLSHYNDGVDADDPSALYDRAVAMLDPVTSDDRDVGTGITYLKVAAGMGDARAARALGEIYSAGTKVSPDLVEAYLWYAVAAKQSADPADTSAA